MIGHTVDVAVGGVMMGKKKTISEDLALPAQRKFMVYRTEDCGKPH